jgi:hypothetical protein
VLAEQHDEWTETRRYIGLDILAKSRCDQAPIEVEVRDEAGDQHDVTVVGSSISAGDLVGDVQPVAGGVADGGAPVPLDDPSSVRADPSASLVRSGPFSFTGATR